MSVVTERYNPHNLAEDTTFVVDRQSIGGFLAKTDGAISVTTYAGTTVVDAVPVFAGIYTPIPAYLDPNGGTVVLTGGASGTLFV